MYEAGSMNLKGTLPTLILHVLSKGPNHGYRIAQEIKCTSRGVLEFREGTLYPDLHSLENRGFLESYEQVEQGRARRYYRITEDGRKALVKQRKHWRVVSKAVTSILEGSPS
jgi:transcriptional regulator